MQANRPDTGLGTGSEPGAPQEPDLRLRLDETLVERGFFQSRARAKDAVARGTVSVDGQVARKAGQLVQPQAQISVADPAARYVSRAALKLLAALDHFAIDAAGTDALDIGASTGGFTQVLLERGARHVTAIDVGTGQLDPQLAADSRVRSMEGLNARHLTESDLGGLRPNLLVSDVSFISLKLALPAALDLAAPGAMGIFLVKPQFEVGRDGIGKGGLLKNPAQGTEIAEELRRWLDRVAGWSSVGLIPSPISGGDGNHEFLLAGEKAT